MCVVIKQSKMQQSKNPVRTCYKNPNYQNHSNKTPTNGTERWNNSTESEEAQQNARDGEVPPSGVGKQKPCSQPEVGGHQKHLTKQKQLKEMVINKGNELERQKRLSNIQHHRESEGHQPEEEEETSSEMQSGKGQSEIALFLFPW